jgi:hypothetical protein
MNTALTKFLAFVRVSTASGSERLLAKSPLVTARGTDTSPQAMLNNFVNRVMNFPFSVSDMSFTIARLVRFRQRQMTT